MPPPMPYTTEKNPALQVIEDFVNNGPRKRLLETLWKLLDGDPIASLDPIGSTSLDHGPANTPAKREEHLNTDWFGFTRTSSDEWGPQKPFHPDTNPTTGFWEHWYGDAEPVFRETLIRAAALSLGLPREDPATTETHRGSPRPPELHGDDQHWPISFLWKCPQPWYEGWIEFQKWGEKPTEGHVTVVLSTPAHGVKLYNSPIRPPGAVGNDPFDAYELDPTEPAGDHGLWVVSQVYHHIWHPPSNEPSEPGRWQPTSLGTSVHSLGPPVVVSPSVPDGGAAPDGIPYLPPTT